MHLGRSIWTRGVVALGVGALFLLGWRADSDGDESSASGSPTIDASGTAWSRDEEEDRRSRTDLGTYSTTPSDETIDGGYSEDENRFSNEDETRGALNGSEVGERSDSDENFSREVNGEPMNEVENNLRIDEEPRFLTETPDPLEQYFYSTEDYGNKDRTVDAKDYLLRAFANVRNDDRGNIEEEGDSVSKSVEADGMPEDRDVFFRVDHGPGQPSAKISGTFGSRKERDLGKVLERGRREGSLDRSPGAGDLSARLRSIAPERNKSDGGHDEFGIADRNGAEFFSRKSDKSANEQFGVNVRRGISRVTEDRARRKRYTNYYSPQSATPMAYVHIQSAYPVPAAPPANRKCVRCMVVYKPCPSAPRPPPRIVLPTYKYQEPASKWRGLKYGGREIR
ncbi:uncharacterized protein LOC143348056 [Colletes latitarsis]|uniref:uncharacterized protein LOC143348056 n=1 Tax=Colletes latitarsis TaxID=2605962 RepID=UPI004036B8C3